MTTDQIPSQDLMFVFFVVIYFKVFDNMGQKYAVVELNQHPQCNQVQDVLNDLTGARTVSYKLKAIRYVSFNFTEKISLTFILFCVSFPGSSSFC